MRDLLTPVAVNVLITQLAVATGNTMNRTVNPLPNTPGNTLPRLPTLPESVDRPRLNYVRVCVLREVPEIQVEASRGRSLPRT